MRILVTGGAGYVGSHAAKLLAESGHDVVIVDNLAEGHRAAVGKLPLVTADLLDREAITEVLKKHRIEAVMHFAAFAYVGVSVREPAKYYHNNIVGTLALLDAMLAVDVRKIVFSSTCATYGIPTKVPIREDHPQAPINPYGFTKLAIEHALADYAHAYGLGYSALRYFNASGAAADGTIGEDHEPETHLIPLVLQVALGQRESVDIFGTDYPTPDGTCVRDYIHVDDLAAAHLAAIQKLGDGTALKLNLGTGCGVSVQEVVDVAREVTGHKIPTKHAPRREGDPPELVADPAAAKRELGWEAQHKDMRGIIESAWRWHQAHPHGYGDRARK
jgi:UDP-glucose-4-epimerase GalE